MPVEIRELIIKANVNSGVNDSQTTSSGGDQDELVRTCVDQVLRILQREKER